MLDETRKRVLAIDYGSKRVGIAISDPLCLFPSITITIPNDKNFFSKIMNLIREKNVNKIILGYPFNDNGVTSDLGKEILKFRTRFENILKIKIDLWDEHLTSKMAASRIISSVAKKSKRRNKSLVDAHAAAIILEEYLRSSEKK
jgi:putative holliday junction resolvase